jgi:hypothetical protein
MCVLLRPRRTGPADARTLDNPSSSECTSSSSVSVRRAPPAAVAAARSLPVGLWEAMAAQLPPIRDPFADMLLRSTATALLGTTVLFSSWPRADARVEFQIPPQVSRYASFMFSFLGRGLCTSFPSPVAIAIFERGSAPACSLERERCTIALVLKGMRAAADCYPPALQSTSSSAPLCSAMHGTNIWLAGSSSSWASAMPLWSSCRPSSRLPTCGEYFRSLRLASVSLPLDHSKSGD